MTNSDYRETDIFSINEKGGFTEKYRHIVYSNLTCKYYYHVAQLIGINPADNCCLFSTNAGTSVKTITETPLAPAIVTVTS